MHTNRLTDFCKTTHVSEVRYVFTGLGAMSMTNFRFQTSNSFCWSHIQKREVNIFWPRENTIFNLHILIQGSWKSFNLRDERFGKLWVCGNKGYNGNFCKTWAVVGTNKHLLEHISKKSARDGEILFFAIQIQTSKLFKRNLINCTHFYLWFHQVMRSLARFQKP